MQDKPIQVAISGAAGQISYALLFRLAAGGLLGPSCPISLRLLEVGPMLPRLEGVRMELEDGAFPLLADLCCTDDPERAFGDADIALMVGAKPRGPGMERADLLRDNGMIFKSLGAVINAVSSSNIRICVVGNPANTNALLLRHAAPDINPRNITALTRLDHNRAIALLAGHCKAPISQLERMIVWGNHSTTQLADPSHALLAAQPLIEQLDKQWVEEDFVTTVAHRGAAVIAARGASSAASAAHAIVAHMRDWCLGTPPGDWVSMAVPSDGSYGIEQGLVYSFPVVCADGDYQIVRDLEGSTFVHEKRAVSENELRAERDAVRQWL